MNVSCNPRMHRGDRNVFCPYYGDCLDHAIREAWDSWDCACCENRNDQRAKPDFPWSENHTVAYYELPAGF